MWLFAGADASSFSKYNWMLLIKSRSESSEQQPRQEGRAGVARSTCRRKRSPDADKPHLNDNDHIRDQELHHYTATRIPSPSLFIFFINLFQHAARSTASSKMSLCWQSHRDAPAFVSRHNNTHSCFRVTSTTRPSTHTQPLPLHTRTSDTLKY